MGLEAGTVERVLTMWDRWEHEPRPEALRARLANPTGEPDEGYELAHQMLVRVNA